jgi:predicted DNA-binding ribbon-helix-helix protein
MWEGLEEICRREHQTLHEICTVIENQRGLLSLTAAVRVFILTYFRAAATEAGHKAAGHGKQPEHERNIAAIAAVKRQGRAGQIRRSKQASG